MTREKTHKPAVLVVDDEALIRWSLSEALAEAGFAVGMAANGAEARVVLAAYGRDPLVVLLDMRLPDVNDLSLAREIRARRTDAPLILMSAHLTPDDVKAAEALRIFRVVSKPFDVREVVKLVGEAWPGHRGPQEEVT